MAGNVLSRSARSPPVRDRDPSRARVRKIAAGPATLLDTCTPGLRGTYRTWLRRLWGAGGWAAPRAPRSWGVGSTEHVWGVLLLAGRHSAHTRPAHHLHDRLTLQLASG